MECVSTPKVQAEQAIVFGETPVNPKACPYHEQDPEGLVRGVPLRTRRPRTSTSIKFWKTPVADCGDGKKRLHGLHAWQQAWTQLKG